MGGADCTVITPYKNICDRQRFVHGAADLGARKPFLADFYNLMSYALEIAMATLHTTHTSSSPTVNSRLMDPTETASGHMYTQHDRRVLQACQNARSGA